MDNETTYAKRKHRNTDGAPKDKFKRLRNWLNIIFMIGAIVGMAVYFFSDTTAGTIIIITAMVFKFFESTLRFIR